MTSGQIKELENSLAALRALADSRGWAILVETLKGDIVAAAISLADHPLMSEKEVDFRRGAISAARNLLNVVPSLIQRTENDILLASANADAFTNLNATAKKE